MGIWIQVNFGNVQIVWYQFFVVRRAVWSLLLLHCMVTVQCSEESRDNLTLVVAFWSLSGYMYWVVTRIDGSTVPKWTELIFWSCSLTNRKYSCQSHYRCWYSCEKHLTPCAFILDAYFKCPLLLNCWGRMKLFEKGCWGRCLRPGTETWRKLDNKVLHNLNSSPYIIKSRNDMGWAYSMYLGNSWGKVAAWMT